MAPVSSLCPERGASTLPGNSSPPGSGEIGVRACVPSCFSRVRLFGPWTVFHQAPLSMGQEYLSGLPCPSLDLPTPDIELPSLLSFASAGVFFTTSATWEALEGKEGRGEMLQVAGWRGSARWGSEVGIGRAWHKQRPIEPMAGAGERSCQVFRRGSLDK